MKNKFKMNQMIKTLKQFAEKLFEGKLKGNSDQLLFNWLYNKFPNKDNEWLTQKFVSSQKSIDIYVSKLKKDKYLQLLK
jgi:hypothetical protein